MGNCCSGAQPAPKHFQARQQVSLFAPEEGQVKSELCHTGQRFLKIREVSAHWWEMVAEENGFCGVASRFHFFPDEGEEEKAVWYFGNLARADAEELLSSPANTQGGFLVRVSPHTGSLVISVKSYSEEAGQYRFRHYPVAQNIEEEEAFRLSETMKGSNLGDLIKACQEPTAGPLVGAPCLVPNPTAEPALVRGWELECQPDAWMVPRDELELGSELGHGYFGEVSRAVWRGETAVAVKSLRNREGKERDYEREKETFLKETEVMKTLNHPNLVKMLGVCIEKSPFYLVQELCSNGDLRNHLKSFDFVKTLAQGAKNKEKFEKVPKFPRLVSWCMDIIRGMSYLETQFLVHRDLAARNVLLDGNLRAKVADFGLTQKDDLEPDSEERAMAVLWSAPEAIEKKEFSHKSDVWSFGVTMWEVLSFADKPYKGLTKAKVKERLKTGSYMMEPPTNYLRHNKKSWTAAYQVMAHCWARQPRARPSFPHLAVEVERLLAGEREGRRLYRQAWAEAKQTKESSRRASLAKSLQVRSRAASPEYDVSLATASYEYDVITP